MFTTTNRDDLKNYLSKEIAQHQFTARLKNSTAQLLFLSVIVISALGLVNPGTKWFGTDGLTVLAVVPGIILLICNTFKFEQGSKWNKLKQRKLEALYRRLVFEDAPIDEISKEVSTELEKLDELRVLMEKPIK